MDWLKKPSTTGGAVYLLMVVVALVGLCVAALGAWRTGCLALAGALGFGLVMRAVLPEERAGMLAVRSRWFDLLTLGVLTAAVVVLVLTMPDFPPE